MQIKMQFVGLEKVRKHLENLSGAQARQAYARAINDTAYQVRRAMQAEMGKAFDRPTPYVLRSVQVRQATEHDLVATIEPTYYGGKGVDPQKILQAQEFGGARRDKRSEVALRRAGILPSGYQTAIPEAPFPGSDDGRGNLKGSFLVQLITYFQAAGEQGYRANMSAGRKQKLADKTRFSSLATRREYSLTRGVVYFVSHGRLRGTHLAPGIWARTGIHGSKVQPVLMFVRGGAYKPRLGMDRIAKEAGTEDYLARRLRYRIRQAAGV